jgi:indole-3-glycerol phosphate synthase
MDFLTTIVESMQEQVAQARRRVPQSRLKAQALEPRSRRSLFKALAAPGPFGANVIAEIKRASPSKGPIRLDLDAAAYARAYARGGAAALSVLTEPAFFKGCIQDLRQAKAAADLPVLRKDFMISEYQFYESAVLGADAVLLIVRILSESQLRDFLALSRQLGLDALVEVHNEADLELACLAGAKLIGINNRNLSSFETNRDTVLKMAGHLTTDQVGVAASGIRSRADMQPVIAGGIFNFLVGESLVRAPDPEKAVADLLGVPCHSPGNALVPGASIFGVLC